MAKKKASSGRKAYPHVAGALFCDKILAEKDGTDTLVRVIDRVTLRGPVDKMPPTLVQTQAFIKFVSGDAEGIYKLSMSVRSPSQKRTKIGEENELVMISGKHSSAIHATFGAVMKAPGVYWFDIYLDEQLMTSMPLEVVYEKFADAELKKTKKKTKKTREMSSKKTTTKKTPRRTTKKKTPKK